MTSPSDNKPAPNPWGELLLAGVIALVALFLIGVFGGRDDTIPTLVGVVTLSLITYPLVEWGLGLFRRWRPGARAADPHGPWPAGAHLVVLAALLAISLTFQARLEALDFAWAIVVVLGFLLLFHTYRSIRRLTGLGGVASGVATVVAISVVSMVPETLRMAGLTDLPGLSIAARGEGQSDLDLDVGGLPPVTETTEASHFMGATAANTTPAELDDLMEGW
jgi:hypothetical protein